VSYSWPDAEAKARAALSYLRRRAEAIGMVVEEWHEEYFGAHAFGGPTVPVTDCEPPEVMGRLAWRCATAEEAGRLGREVGLLGLSGPPMIAASDRARGGKPSQLLALDAIAVPRELVDAQVRVALES
jgi:hypothetical protein